MSQPSDLKVPMQTAYFRVSLEGFELNTDVSQNAELKSPSLSLRQQVLQMHRIKKVALKPEPDG